MYNFIIPCSPSHVIVPKYSHVGASLRYSLPYRPIVLVDMARKGTGSWKKLVNGDLESLR